jgi:DNA repair exonuclease SbcCD ATPase subunit
MSQTETLLLFVLGFCVALFVVLLFGRGIWALIGSWSGWRETRKVPAAIRELQAERDSLKAEKAMMAQKLEASLNDMKMRMAEQMAEVSRNRNRLLDMGQTLKEREATIGHVQAQTDDKVAQLASSQTQIEDNVKAINLAYAKMAQREEEHLKMQGVLKEAQATLLMRDEKIRNLVDEAKALRELVTGRTPDVAALSASVERTSLAPILVAAATPAVSNSFEQRFANGNSGNPLVAEVGMDMSEASDVSRSEESDNIDRGVSNVLSLAERVRSLQSGMKKG